MGTIVKQYFAQKIGSSGDKIYHTTVMPCYDKKLEASRDDFYDDILKSRDVDCVLTSGEIINIITQKGIDFIALPESPVEKLFTNISSNDQLFGITGGSDGYLEFIFRYAAKELFGVSVDTIKYKPLGRSAGSDFQVTTLEVNGETVLTFATAYGFKNIQNVVRKLKQKGKKQDNQSKFDFIEIMACPSGCLNGGGQIRAEKGEDSKQRLRRVEEVYSKQQISFPENNFEVQEIYKTWLDGVFTSNAITKLHTQYHMRERINNPLAIKW